MFGRVAAVLVGLVTVIFVSRVAVLQTSGPVTTPGVLACSNNCQAGYGLEVGGDPTLCRPCHPGTFNSGNSQYCTALPVCPNGAHVFFFRVV